MVAWHSFPKKDGKSFLTGANFYFLNNYIFFKIRSYIYSLSLSHTKYIKPSSPPIKIMMKGVIFFIFSIEPKGLCYFLSLSPTTYKKPFIYISKNYENRCYFFSSPFTGKQLSWVFNSHSHIPNTINPSSAPIKNMKKGVNFLSFSPLNQRGKTIISGILV